MLPAEVITLTPKQSNIYVYGWQPNARHRVAVCGRRFGKTFLCRREIKRAVQLAAKRGISPDNEIWYGAPTAKQAKRVFWRALKRAIPAHWILGKPNETECSITVKSGHVVRIVGLDNYDDLRGSGLWFFIGDEWADCNPLCWTEVIQPMLATCQGHSLKIGTPKGFNHFHEDYQKGQPNAIDKTGEKIADYKSWAYTTIQGGNVPQSEIETARNSLDARTFRQEWEGSFESYAGQVLYAFRRTYSVKPCPYDANKPVHVGMDFNINPMSATIWQESGPIVDGVPQISCQIGEVIIPTSDTDEMSKEIIRRFGFVTPDGQQRFGVSYKMVDGVNYAVSHIHIYPDPAGAQNRTSAQGKTDISILRGYGFDVQAMRSHPLVRDRINVTNSRFTNAKGEHRAFVDPTCVTSIMAYERLEYKDGTGDPDKKSGYDHPVDATGYYFYVRYGGTGVTMAKITGY